MTNNDSDATVLEIGSAGTSQYRAIFDFYAVGDYQSPTGIRYSTHAGYYYYLLSGNKAGRLLAAQTQEELNRRRKANPWMHREGLEELLYENLVHNTASKPLLRAGIPKGTRVTWTEPGRKLNAAEKRWLKVVQRYIDEA
jgi:hypothetical protein